MKFKTEQENFWAESFGKDYINRNKSNKLLASNVNFFAKALNSTTNVKTCLEFGANIGINIKALRLLYPEQKFSAIEINPSAVEELKKEIPENNIYEGSILNFNPTQFFDLVLVKGVLIHINPDELNDVYKKLVASCGKYLLIAEYYNPSPVSVIYRGHTNKLFKRDFAGEIMDQYPMMELLDYGFSYRRDPKFPLDDITWFLMEKN
jgi:pseudaminic acid biosynthesis-associated methylase